MKIIRHGDSLKERIWVGKCRHCNSVAEARESELQHITWDSRKGNYLSREVCPVCCAGGIGNANDGMLFSPKPERGAYV